MDRDANWFVEKVTPEEYESAVADRRVFFNEPRFCELNRDKVDEVEYLLIKRNESTRFALILGRRANVAKCPFSAPYSYPVAVKPDATQEDIDDALDALENHCMEEGISELYFTFPPLFYDEHLLSGWVSAFYRHRYEVINLDLSYALNLDKLNVDEETYVEIVPPKGRKGLRRARRQNLSIVHCETDAEFREAYEIIKIGHAAKGFPVKLSYEQLMATLELVEHDAFIVKCGDTGIVAEYLYRINDRIVQGIYTGTHPDYADRNGMNLLTYHTIRHYGNRGFRILDKAAATESSVPNYGLANFKESVGCERSLKYSFCKRLARG